MKICRGSLLPCLFFLVGVVVFFGQACNHTRSGGKLANSIRLTERHLAGAKDDFWKGMYEELLVALRSTSARNLDVPAIAAAGVFRVRDSVTFLAYWIEDAPSVDGIAVTGHDNQTLLTLEMPELYRRENEKDVREGVVCHVAYSWPAAQMPPAFSAEGVFAQLVIARKPSSKRIPIRSGSVPSSSQATTRLGD